MGKWRGFEPAPRGVRTPVLDRAVAPRVNTDQDDLLPNATKSFRKCRSSGLSPSDLTEIVT